MFTREFKVVTEYNHTCDFCKRRTVKREFIQIRKLAKGERQMSKSSAIVSETCNSCGYVYTDDALVEAVNSPYGDANELVQMAIDANFIYANV